MRLFSNIPLRESTKRIPRKQCLVNTFTTCGKVQSFEEQLVRLRRACWGPVAFLGHVWGPQSSSRHGALHKRIRSALDPQSPTENFSTAASARCFSAARPRLLSGFLNCLTPPAEMDTWRRPPAALFMLTRSQSSH